MSTKKFGSAVLAGGALLCSACQTAPATVPQAAPAAPSTLQVAAAELAADPAVPAVGLAVMTCKSQELATAGLLRVDGDDQIAADSRFAIGSNAKSMLATAAARLARRGMLSLDDTIAALWPAAAAAHPDKAGITLAQLLGHASGLPGFDTGAELRTVPEFEGSQREVGIAAAEWFLAQPLETEPGTATAYSNAGYVIAAELVSRAAGKDFRQVVAEEVFVPLGIEAAYGEPRRMPGTQPFGHTATETGIAPYLDEDPPIPTWLEGAGNVAIPVGGYARYVRAHLCALRGESDFLDEALAERLHTPVLDGGAAMGWGRTELAGRPTSFHIGGTGDFTAYMALSPESDRAALAVMNVGGAPAASGQKWLIATMTAE